MFICRSACWYRRHKELGSACCCSAARPGVEGVPLLVAICACAVVAVVAVVIVVVVATVELGAAEAYMAVGAFVTGAVVVLALPHASGLAKDAQRP